MSGSRSSDSVTMATGHFDSVAVKSVTQAAGVASANSEILDEANRIVKNRGQAPYRMAVVCTGNNGQRVAEVEFVVRFGL